MGIHEDAWQGTLVGDVLDNYLKNDPNAINEQDPLEGRTPLAAATVGGHAEVVDELLKKGAKADALSRDGETPLLLAASEANYNRPRIIQLLLGKTLSVDATCLTAERNTPLMFVTKKKDIESIRLLRKAGASLVLTNNDNKNAEAIAKETEDDAVIDALNPDKERSALIEIAAMVVSFLLFIVAWVNDAPYVNDAGKEVFSRMRRLNSDLYLKTDQAVNRPDQPGRPRPNKAKFVENVDKYVKAKPVLKYFFENKEDYIKELAQKAADLENNPSTALGNKDLLPKTIEVSLHQQVIYCDDSGSMSHLDGRWDSQKKLVERITQITTRILPEGEGVALRFINQDNKDGDDSPNLAFGKIAKILGEMSWKPKSGTYIGTNLKSKILEPLVYSKLESKSLERPLLISVITDGCPSENDSNFVDVILECGTKLKDAGYPRKSVKFMVGQIGTDENATTFLAGLKKTIKKNRKFAKVVYCTAEQLDEKFKDFHNKEGLDQWLIETLFSSIKDRKDKKDQ